MLTRTANALVLLPFIILIIVMFHSTGIQRTIRLLLLILWIPAGLGYDYMQLYLFEICVYIVAFLIMIRYPRIDDEQHSDDYRIKEYLVEYPWYASLLYFVGALLTWLFSTKVHGELSIIRIQCIYPLALSLIIFVSVRSAEDAERFLRALLTAAGILGLLFLVGQHFTDYIRPTYYALDSGRNSMTLLLPHHLGSLEMLPQRTSCIYAYLLMYAYSIWTFHHSLYRRVYALCLCTIFGCVILTTQGRGGALAAGIGAGIISLYASSTRRKYGLGGVWIKFLLICLAVIGGLWYLAAHSSNEVYYQHGVALFNNPLQDENLLGRLQRLSDAVVLYKANPILGTGLRGYETPWGLDTSELLNVFLYTLLSFGLLGFIAFLVILRRFIVALLKGTRSGNRTSTMICLPGICGLLGFFFGLQSLEPYSMALLWTPLVLALAVSRLNAAPPVIKPGSQNVTKCLDKGWHMLRYT